MNREPRKRERKKEIVGYIGRYLPKYRHAKKKKDREDGSLRHCRYSSTSSFLR